jgi:hypothetical protein
VQAPPGSTARYKFIKKLHICKVDKTVAVSTLELAWRRGFFYLSTNVLNHFLLDLCVLSNACTIAVSDPCVPVADAPRSCTN